LRLITLGACAVRREDGTDAVIPRRRLALLVAIAAADRGVSREKLLGLLWPELDEERGRAALSQALYALRKDLGAEEAITGTTDLKLDPTLIDCDRTTFLRAISEGEDELAVMTYRGPYLDGFYVREAPEFESQLEEERQRLASWYAAALERVAGKLGGSGDHAAAVRVWKQRAALGPTDATVAVSLMRALADAGDRAGALRHAEVYAELLQSSMGLPPEEKVLAFAAELRSSSALGPRPSPGSTPPATGPAPARSGADTVPADSPTPIRGMFIRLLLIAAVVLLVLRLLPDSWRREITGSGGETGPRLIAVTDFQDFAGDSLTGPLAELLRTSLANIPGLGVISGERMAEGKARAGDAGPLAVAREAGASEVLNGALYRRTDGSLRFDLRRVDPADGQVIEAIEVEGGDVFRLTTLATRRLIERYGIPTPEGDLTRVSSSSLTAIRLYQAGLDAYTAADAPAAYALFDRATREDTSFAMAEFYAAWVAPTDSIRSQRLDQAHQLALNASLRERLIIDMHRGDWNSATNTLPLAESLTTLFPQEIAGHFQLGRSRLYHAGDFIGAERAYRQALRMDTVGFTAYGKRCDACAARSGIITSLMFADSLPAARREAEAWTRAYPKDPYAWRFLTMVASILGDSATAAAGVARVVELEDLIDEERVGSAFYSALYLGKVERADSILAAQLATGPRSRRPALQWMLTHLRREQGRPKAAAAAMLEWRRLMGRGLPVDANFQGQTLFEAGDIRGAERLWDSIGKLRTTHPSRDARGWTWSHTLQSLALAGLGDTARLLPIADSMQEISLASGFARDRRLHHHVQALYWMARGDDVKALAEFRESVWSYTGGYTQTDLLMARVLMRLGQPREAARVCGSGLHAEMAASAQYVTRGEFHECAGRAWLAAGEKDSARYHLRVAVAQWAGAEPSFAARRDSLRDLLGRLGG